MKSWGPNIAPGRTGQDRTGQDRTGQDRTGQDRTGQDRTGQDRTGYKQTEVGLVKFRKCRSLVWITVCNVCLTREVKCRVPR
jgi:hypothetical protein